MQKDMEVPLLEVLVEIGGQGKPKDIYPLVTKKFPKMTNEELAQKLKSGGNRWKNRIQFVRQALVGKGEIDKSIKGIWAITDKGRERLNLPAPEKPKKVNRHNSAVDKWVADERSRFGTFFEPEINVTKVNLNDVLPKDIWLKENSKEIDGLSRLKIGGQTFYLSVLEVQYKGSKEDLCVRVSIILPFVTRVDIVSDEESLKKIKEFLDRLCDPIIVKSRVRFYSFKKFLGASYF